MSLTIGSRLGPYEIVAPLGAGGMGEVYRARDPRLGRDVAIKVLPQDVAGDSDRLARFEREARTVAALNHPNIVVIHSIEETHGTRFLTMELVEGRSLDQLVIPGGLPLARVLDLAIPLADALVAAHGRGVVHRDLKPGNVMVTPEGRVKVLDFGLAKTAATDSTLAATQAATVAAPISNVGQVMGTVPYMAPEQLRGEAADARADLFALGILMYELVTGRRPFAGSSSVEVSSAILRDTPLPAQTLRGDMPPDLGRIIGRCLEKDPERRVQTAKDVRNELEIVRRETQGGALPSRSERPPASAHVVAPALAPASSPAAAAADVPSVAVLPFVNRSGDVEDEYFSDGLADELLSVLAKIRGLRVAARTSSASFKGKAATIAEIGQALHVASVLEGSVRKSGNRVRISVQLVKVKDGYPLWSETYDRTLDDIFAVQDDIAQCVVKELRTTLLGAMADTGASGEARAEVAAAARGRGEIPEAHRLYLEGKHFVDRMNPEDNARGIARLEQALAIDPGHASAWVGLARAHTWSAAYGWAPVVEADRNARQSIGRALELAPELPDVHLTRARIQRMLDWDRKGAEASVRRALELAPGLAEALIEAAALAHDSGRFEEALDLIEDAVRRDPLSTRAYNQLGLTYRAIGRLEEAEAAYRKSLEIAPQRITAHMIISLVSADRGDVDQAIREANLEPSEWGRLTALAYAYEKAGRRQESDAALQRLELEFPHETAYQIAALYAQRGNSDAAFAWLDRGVEQRDTGMAQAYSEPTFRSLHDDPRWGEFLRKIRFAE